MEDAEGREIGLRAYDESAFEALVEMYVDFDPSQRAQGTPPVGEEGVREWLSETLLSGPSVVAWHGQRAVGHVAFVPDDTGKHELAIFVHQDYQRAGIGDALVESGFGHAREKGVSQVWLTVEPWRRGIAKFYSDHGFDTVNAYGSIHRMSRYL
jgi:predicted N-acetyltransferase YhbS